MTAWQSESIREYVSCTLTHCVTSQWDDPVAAFDDAEQVHRGLARIAVHYREVLTLFFMQDLSLLEIEYQIAELADKSSSGQ